MPLVATTTPQLIELSQLNEPVSFKVSDLQGSLTAGAQIQVFLNYVKAEWIVPQVDMTGQSVVVRVLGDPNDANAAAHARQVRKILGSSPGKNGLTICAKLANGPCVGRMLALRAANGWDGLWIGLLAATLLMPGLFPRLLHTGVRDSTGRRTVLERVSLSATIFYTWNFAVLISVAYIRARTGEWTVNQTALALLGVGSAIRGGAKFVPGSRLGAVATQPFFVASATAAAGIGVLVAPTSVTSDPRQPGPAQQPPAPTPPTDSDGRSPNALALFQPVLRIASQLLADSDGPAMHRIQLAGWTAILLVWYMRAVYIDWALPEFDISLIGISVVSGALHLASKRNERISRSELISPTRSKKIHAPADYTNTRKPPASWRARLSHPLQRIFYRNRAGHKEGEQPEERKGFEEPRRKHAKQSDSNPSVRKSERDKYDG